MRTIISLILLTYLANQVFSTECNSDKDLNKLKNSIDSIAVKNKLPGISICFVSKDSITDRYNYGYSNLENKIVVNSNTPFKLGSITKSFLALAIMKLNYEGEIDLNETIKELIPEISFINPWEDTHPIKIIHLLEHTSGFDDIHLNDLSIINISDIPLSQVLKHQEKSLVSRWKPGMYNSYSSVGYTVLGYILEKVTGVKYEEYIEQKIFTPLKMYESSLFWNEFPVQITLGYDNNYNVLPNTYMYARPAGSMYSDIEDMSKFVRMMLNYGALGDCQILPKEIIQKMETPQSSISSRKGIKIGFGAGIISNLKNGQKWHYHNGGGPGCLASYYYSRELEKGFCLLTNSMNIEAVNSIKALLINEITKDLEQQNNTLDIVAKRGEKTFVGYFKLMNHRNEIFSFLEDIFSGIKVFKQGDTLVIKELFTSEKVFVHSDNNLYKKNGEKEVSACIYTTELNKMGISVGSIYYEKTSHFKFLSIWAYIGLISFLIIFVIVDLVVSLIKNSIQLILRKKLKVKYLILKFSHLLSFSMIIVPIILVSSQSTVEYSLKTTENMMFCIGGWVFFVMSILNIIYSVIRRVHDQKSAWQVFYIASSTLIFSFALTLFNLGIIGLKLWSY
ncbi:serine hydrolase domain-containing protein [Bacteroidota bacterium]